MKKVQIFWYILESIFLIVFNLYFFLLKETDHVTSVWISYGAIHFSYLVLLATPYFVQKGSASADYGRPLFVLTTAYFFVTLVIGVLFVLIAPESNTLVIIVHTTTAAIFAFLLFVNLIANDHTAENIEKQEVELRYVKEASSKLHLLLHQLPEKKHQKLVEKAYDLIDSSQVKTSVEVQMLEKGVSKEISNLEYLVQNKDYENVEGSVGKICSLAEERNSKLKLLNRN